MLSTIKVSIAMIAGVMSGLIATSDPAAAEARARWQGTAVIQAMEPGPCAAAQTIPIKVGTRFRSQFHPRKIKFNGDDTTISLFAPDSAFILRVTNGDFTGAGSYTGVARSNQALNLPVASGTYLGASVTPSTVTADTPSVTIIAAVSDFFGAPGCSVIFQGHYVRRYE